MNTVHISIVQFLLGFLLIIIPSYFLYRYKTGLTRSTLWAALRMSVQLFLIGFYLEYLFKWNSALINCTWVLIMVVIAAATVVERTGLKWRKMVLPIAFAFFVSIVLIDLYFLGIVLRLPELFDARYFIPISGMILGNMLSANVIALNVFCGDLSRERSLYLYLLGNGATKPEALSPFIKNALVKSFSPTVASMAVMGLIALPGTMTGQILGGSSPALAIRYQILIMITIFASSLISVLMTLWSVERTMFYKDGVPKEG